MPSRCTLMFCTVLVCAWYHAAGKREVKQVTLDMDELLVEQHLRATVDLKQKRLDSEVARRPGFIAPVDWIFDFEGSASCNNPSWNTTPQSLESRVFLPLFLFIIVGCVVFAGTVEVPEVQKNIVIAKRPRERRLELDYARVVCVAFVVVEHSGGTHWTAHNVLFVLQWMLPYLYITSGIAFMMSQKSMSGFNLRLSAILVVGTAANWMADMLTGRNWQGDFGNTIYQMFYVVMLILMSFLARPLRHALQHPGEQTQIAHWAPTVIFGIITVVALFFFVIAQSPIAKAGVNINSTWMTSYAPILDNAPIAMIQVSGILFLCHVACCNHPNDLLAWVLLAFIYIPRVLIPWEKVSFFHNIEIFVFAMVTEVWKIRGYKRIQLWVGSYWPIPLFLLIVTSIPDIFGRCDLMPPNTIWERARFYSIEFVLVLFLSAGVFKVGDPFGALEWLNRWALYAYCFHVCWARLLPSPYGCVLTFSSGILFYGMHRRGKGSADTAKGDVVATNS